MKNRESDPQNHETGLQHDEGCIFSVFKGTASAVWFGLPDFWSSFVCLWGVGTTVSAVLSRLVPPAALRGQAGKTKPAPKSVGPGEGMLCQRSTRPALVSTAPHSAPVHASISTRGINCCLNGKRTRIRRIKAQYSLRALSSCREASLPVGLLNIWPTFVSEHWKVVQASGQKKSSQVTY